MKKKYRCPWCGRRTKLWPDVFAGECPNPKCEGIGSLLHELMDRGEVSLECAHCGTAITSWITVVQNKCYKCNQPHGIVDRIAKAKDEVQTKKKKRQKVTFYRVICSKCNKRIETSHLVESGSIPAIFPKAGFCPICGVVCWSCAAMYRASGIQEANEIRAMGNAGTLIALTNANGNVMSPRCPTHDCFLTEIRDGKETFSVVSVRKAIPGKRWWQLWK